jgi:citrate lyase beta subunit
VPGSRPDRFEKAAAAGADLVCIDLEDAVAPGGKAEARRATLAFLAQREGAPTVGLRVNEVGTGAGRDDLEALKDARGIAFVMVPKPSGTEALDEVHAAYGRDRVIPVLESARAVQRADEIADHPAVVAGVYGAIDLAADIGCSLDWEAQLYARSRCALAFGAARKVLFDVPYLDVADPEGLKAETLRSKALGIPARAAIHPAQLAPIHEALSPTEEEAARAARVVEAFDRAEGGVALLDGKLIELPVIKSARRVLALAGR